jgi:hypothetical protein
MPILIRKPDGPYFSPGDERAFFEWVNRIPCVSRLEGEGEELRLHVNGRRVNQTCLRELIALFHRYGVSMGQLAQFETLSNQSWFRNPAAFWYVPVFGRPSNKRVKPAAARHGGKIAAPRRRGLRAGR